MRRPSGSGGFGAAESIVGLGLALGVILAALILARGVLVLGHGVSIKTGREVAAAWVLDRIGQEIVQAGVGVGIVEGSPDEAIEYLTGGAVGVRGDLDGDDRLERERPEQWLTGHFPLVPTANDEVVLFLRRVGSRGGSERARFDADLDSDDRVTLTDGTLLARRDGVVEEIDAGPYAGAGDARAGTLYRVSFVHNARRAGSGRFRNVQPMLDKVTAFRVTAFDAENRALDPCGGADDAASRICRARVRRVAIEVRLEGSPRALRREYALHGVVVAAAGG